MTIIQKLFSACLLVIWALSPALSNAQNHYEGSILINLYTGESMEQVQLFVKENRLKISALDENVSSGLPIATSSVLLRADSRDLIAFVDEKSAIQLRLAEIESLINMLGGPDVMRQIQEQSEETMKEVEESVRMMRTGDTRTFHGYSADLYTIIPEDSEEEIHMWFSDEIYIDWTTMMSAFGNFATQLGGDEWLDRLGLEANSFPLQISVVENNVETVIMQVEEIQSRRLTSDEIDVPSGVQLMSFFQYMLQNGQQ